MKKKLILSILTYLLFSINTSTADISSSEKDLSNQKVLKVGVLFPLSGEYKNVGESFLKAVKLALYDISNENIKIYLKDSKANAADSFKAAKEFEDLGIKIVIGPIFHESLERLDEISNVTFISLTNKTENIPKNTKIVPK